MMKSIKSMLMGGAILLGLTMCLTSCEGTLDDIFGEWSRPTGNNGNTKTTVAVKSVTLDQTTLTKAVGDDAVTLTATVDPSDASDKTVTWKSSDASIAAVDANGKVTFGAAGTATITATATNGTEDTADDKTATCEVTISAKKVNVESVKLDQPTLTATVGDAAVTLTATVTPDDATDKTVKWTSSNESVATVADGVVTFVAAGTATITATAPNGTDDTADDKTAKCAVTVNAAAAKVTTAPTATTGTIAAGSTTALVTAGAADGGTMMYQVTATNAKPTTTDGFSATVPTAAPLAAGTYYVWYYAKADATHVDSEISASAVAVTVIAVATSLSLDKTMKVLVKGGATLTITPNVTPSAVTVTWTSSKESVATVNNGVVTPKGLGITTITAKSGDLTATCEVFVGTEVALGLSNYIAQNYDILKGDMGAGGYSVTIPAGYKVAFDGLATTGGITCNGDATIYLTDASMNTVSVAASSVAGIQIGDAGTTLTINAETLGTGQLTATGRDDCAAIGTAIAINDDIVGGNITINGGVINATSGGSNGGAAGIGTGYAENHKNECGAITINGGTVTATCSVASGVGGAGIGTGGALAHGGSASNKCGAITINGGTVIAQGGERAAGIGTGLSIVATTGLASNGCGNITIGTGVKSVTATKGDGSPNSIGKGKAVSGTQECGTISIADPSKVTQN